MAITAIDHIGVAVKNMDQAAAQFENLLGLTISAQEEVEDQQLIAALVPTDTTRFELMQPTDPESVVGRFLDRSGEGIHHICFEVDDIQREIDELKAREVQLVQGAPREGFVGQVEFIHPRAAGGVLVEIAQIELRSPTSCGLSLHHATVATEDSEGVSNLWKKNLNVIDHTRTDANTDASLVAGTQSHLVDGQAGQGDSLVEFRQSVDTSSSIAEFIENGGRGVYSLTLTAQDLSKVPFHQKTGKTIITPDELVGLRIVLQ